MTQSVAQTMHSRMVEWIGRISKEAVVIWFKVGTYYSGTCLEGQRKTTKISVRLAGLRAEIRNCLNDYVFRLNTD
jgi:hypothetical protein